MRPHERSRRSPQGSRSRGGPRRRRSLSADRIEDLHRPSQVRLRAGVAPRKRDRHVGTRGRTCSAFSVGLGVHADGTRSPERVCRAGKTRRAISPRLAMWSLLIGRCGTGAVPSGAAHCIFEDSISVPPDADRHRGAGDNCGAVCVAESAMRQRGARVSEGRMMPSSHRRPVAKSAVDSRLHLLPRSAEVCASERRRLFVEPRAPSPCGAICRATMVQHPRQLLRSPSPRCGGWAR